MKLGAMIVDDEPLARKRVRLLLAEQPDIEIVDECSNGAGALTKIEQNPPDLLFLDVQMPKMDGFELLQALPPDRLPIVIFTTAYDQDALRAFDAHALDYLLKPFKTDRFVQAVQRARDHLKNQQASTAAQGLLAILAEQQHGTNESNGSSAGKYLTRLIVKSDDKVVILRVKDIEHIESAGNYVVAKAGEDNHILRETLSTLEKQLDPEQFIRISRSAIVNLDCIKEFTPGFKGGHTVVLQDGKNLAMTRGMREVEKTLRFS